MSRASLEVPVHEPGPFRPHTHRHAIAVVCAVSALTVVAHVLGATAWKGTMWGADFYAFFPPGILALSIVGLALLGYALDVRLRNETPLIPSALGENRWRVAVMLFTVVAVVAFWYFRIRHALLGDEGALTLHIPTGEHTHPRQPLSLLIHSYSYRWFKGLFGGAARDQTLVAFDTTALDSVLAGALFVPVLVLLARSLVRSVGPLVQPRVVGLAALVLLAQGYAQLFFGYVENYTWFALAMATYVWCALEFLQGRQPLFWASAVLAIAVGLNMSGVVLGPSYLVLVIWGLRDPGRRWGAVRDVGGAIVVALVLLLAVVPHQLGSGLFSTLAYMWRIVVGGEGGDNSLAYQFSYPHLRDVLNIHLLIGPFSAILFLGLAIRATAWRHLGRSQVFLVLAAVPALVATWLLGDPLQGYVKDWDLFAPFGVLYATAGVFMLLGAVGNPSVQKRLLLLALMTSLLHTGGWVALNTSVERSLERMKVVPVSRGRNEFTVGYWYMTHGKPNEAQQWFFRAVSENPGNNAAQYHLGLMALDAERYSEAVHHFRVAVTVRPDKENYRVGLIDGLVMAGHPGEAVPELEQLLRMEPQKAGWWGAYAIALLGAGQPGPAQAALDRARAIAPGDERLSALGDLIRQPGGYESAVEREWFSLIWQRAVPGAGRAETP